MANTILTPTAVTRKALKILHQKANFIGTINRQYDSSFAKEGGKIGSTLKIRMPNEYVVRTGINMVAQETTEVSQDLTVATIKGVDLYFTSEELTLSLDDFSSRILEPAISTLASNIEADVISTVRKQVANLVDGDAAALSYTHISQARQALTEGLAPASPRYVSLAPKHTTKYLLDTKGLFHDSTEVEQMYLEGAIGRGHGFQKFYENTHHGDHTTGTAAKTTGYTVNGTTQSGATITVQSGSTTFLVGDVVTFAGANEVHPETKVSTGALRKFTITANSGTSTTSLAISPSLTVSGPRQNVSGYPTDSGAVVKVGAGANELLNSSLAYHRDAFTFVSADLLLPKGVDFAAREVMDGISMAIVRDFTISDRKFPCRIDVLYGCKCLRPEWAVRIHADG